MVKPKFEMTAFTFFDLIPVASIALTAFVSSVESKSSVSGSLVLSSLLSSFGASEVFSIGVSLSSEEDEEEEDDEEEDDDDDDDDEDDDYDDDEEEDEAEEAESSSSAVSSFVGMLGRSLEVVSSCSLVPGSKSRCI
jgi:hypothetical protein